MLNLSDFQLNIINHVCDSNNNLCVNAVAGSGKTFTSILAIKEYLKKHPKHNVACRAFNKSIADELDAKIKDSRVKCQTSHAFGLVAIRSYIRIKGEKIPLVINDKYLHFKLLNNLSDYSEIIDETTQNDIKWDFIGNVDKLLNLCRLNLITADNVDAICNLAEEHCIVTKADEVHAVRKMLDGIYDLRIERNVKEFKGRTQKTHPRAYVIDFADMLTFGATHGEYCPKYDLVVNDECQDFNKAQHELLFNSVKKGGKWLAVGDPKQAINGFAGAMNDSFFQLSQLADNLPLDVNYRCGSKIIELAQTLVPNITAHDGAIEGEINEVETLKSVQDGDYIICRTKAPLVRVAMRFLRSGRTAQILGADLGANLKSFIRQAVGSSKPSMLISTTALIDKLNAMRDKVQNDILNKGYKGQITAHPTLIEMGDKIECIDNISLECENVGQTLAKIDNLFSDEHRKNAITLMTAHKSKGLENDNVFIILPNKLPLTWEKQNEWQYQQELNLQYVAYTRAKKTLNIVNADYDSLLQIDVE